MGSFLLRIRPVLENQPQINYRALVRPLERQQALPSSMVRSRKAPNCNNSTKLTIRDPNYTSGIPRHQANNSPKRRRQINNSKSTSQNIEPESPLNRSQNQTNSKPQLTKTNEANIQKDQGAIPPQKHGVSKIEGLDLQAKKSPIQPQRFLPYQ